MCENLQIRFAEVVRNLDAVMIILKLEHRISGPKSRIERAFNFNHIALGCNATLNIDVQCALKNIQCALRNIAFSLNH